MKIVIGWRTTDEAVAALRQAHQDVQFVVAQDPESFKRELVDADGAYALRFDSETFKSARKLRWVQSVGAGVEWIRDVPELVASDVTLTNARGAHAGTIAEHTFGLLLALTRNLPELYEAQKAHTWGHPSTPAGLVGLTMGVVGLGNIGRAIARRGHGFEMHVIAVDTNEMPRPDYVSRLDGLGRLDALLRESDVVVIATPITPETRGMISAARLALMKPESYLIVISRGGIVNEAALAQALREKKLAGAGLDVTATEPLPADSPLWDVPNLLITPHSSGVSRQTTAMVWQIFADNAARFIRGEPLENVVDKARGY